MNRAFSRNILAVVASVSLGGCAHVISSDVRQGARSDVTFPMVLANPEVYRGETVIWGGMVIETVNRQDGTVVTVLETPLDAQGMPADGDYTRGRFLVKTSMVLDPEVYRRGRKLTVAGEIMGKEVQPLGETQYGYPVLGLREIHVWKELPSAYAYPWGPYYNWGPYSWYWDWWWWPYGRWRYR